MTHRRTIHEFLAALAVALLPLTAGCALAQDSASSSSASVSPVPPAFRQSLSEAWWTGPMLAPSAGTLPRGHFLLEPYFYDVSAAHSNTFGSLSYLLYGLGHKFTVGVIPTVDYEQVSDGPSSSNLELGDTSLLIQYGLTQFHGSSWHHPTTAINVQETFPTGRYDQLGALPSDGFGSGAYTTALAFYSQTFFWLPNGRILRARFNISDAFSSNVKVQGVSVYGTAAGFNGNAKPGNTAFADAAAEYSLTRRWVLALDVEYHFEANTPVTGFNSPDPGDVPSGVPNPPSIQTNSGSTGELIFAPAIEYNWKPTIGVLLGTRIIEVGHNITPSITPALAINFVH